MSEQQTGRADDLDDAPSSEEGQPPTEDVCKRVDEVLKRVAAAVGADVEVVVENDGEGVRAEFRGEDVALLIGQRGATLDAIQHLAYRIATRGHRGAQSSVWVDAGGYRERRAASLRATADQAARTAVNTGRTVRLDSMGPLDRKVVHEHLKDRHDVETFSEGQEPARRLVIAPIH